MSLTQKNKPELSEAWVWVPASRNHPGLWLSSRVTRPGEAERFPGAEDCPGGHAMGWAFG